MYKGNTIVTLDIEFHINSSETLFREDFPKFTNVVVAPGKKRVTDLRKRLDKERKI